MKIQLPPRIDSKPIEVYDARILIVLGTNGAGKSAFGRELLRCNTTNAVRIAGVSSLFVANEDAEQAVPFCIEKLQAAISTPFAPPRLSAFEHIILQLQDEEIQTSALYKELLKLESQIQIAPTTFEKLLPLWRKLFPSINLICKSGVIEINTKDKGHANYSPKDLSNGEKFALYLIGSVLYAPKDSILIIEKPELLLHHSIKHTLWDELENMRKDCCFVYLTNDIDLASTRPQDAKRVWIRDYDAQQQEWEYEEIPKDVSLPEELVMEILGTRRSLLFIEGTDSGSIDGRLYSLIFPNYMVKPVGGCQKVIELTKSFRELQDFHTMETMGIVDRDRRTEHEVENLRKQHIYVPMVSEVENLLMLEPVIKVVAKRMLKDPQEVFMQVKQNVVHLFRKDLETQVLLHAKHIVKRKLERVADRKIANIKQLALLVEEMQTSISIDEIYYRISEQFMEYVQTEDYENILKYYNQKGMLPQSRLCNLCGINNKESYLNIVVNIIKEGKADAQTIRNCVKKTLGFQQE